MNRIAPCLLICFLFANSIWSQKRQTHNPVFDLCIALEWSMYQWHQRPYTAPTPAGYFYRSSGQVLGFPNVGLELAVGLARYKRFYWVTRGSVVYAPLSLDLAQYKGLGSLAFPVVTGFHKGWRKMRRVRTDEGRLEIRRGSDYFFTVCGGVQWTRTDLYARPNYIPATFPQPAQGYFLTYIGEVALGWGGLGQEIGVFVRAGAGARESFTFNVGIRTAVSPLALR